MPLGAGVLLERGHQRGGPALKRRHFAVIGSNNVKTVADRYIHAAYCIIIVLTSTSDRLLRFINIDNLERP